MGFTDILLKWRNSTKKVLKGDQHVSYQTMESPHKKKGIVCDAYYRVTAQETAGVLPAELMFGRRLRAKLDLLQPNIEGRVQKRQEAMKNRYDQNTKLRELPSGVAVYT